MNYTSLMDGIKKSIDDVAKEISGSKFAKDVLPGMEQVTQETTERLAQKEPVTKGVEKARNYIAGLIAPNVDYDPTASIGRMLKSEDDIDEVVKKQLAILKSKGINDATLNDKTVSKIQKEAHQHYREGLKLAKANPTDGKALYEQLGTIDKAGAIVQTYFSHPDDAVRSNRALGAVGAYMGASVGARVMTGGTLTTDSYGRKNLVGIPFI